MKITITAPKGQTPKLESNVLTANDARLAQNCYTGRGDLRGWYQPLVVEALSVVSAKTLYHYANSNDGPTFLVDVDDLDYVLSPIAEDPYERLYYTGKDEMRVHCNALDLDPGLGPELVADGDNEAACMRFEEIAVADGTAAASAAQAQAGAKSCLITRTTAGNGDFSYTFNDSDLTRVRADDSVTVTGYVYLPSGQTLAAVKIQSYDGTDWTDEATITDTDAWTAFSFTCTPDTAFAVRFLGVGGDQTEFFYVDTVSVKQTALNYYICGIPQPDTTTPVGAIAAAGGGTAEDRSYAYTFVTAQGEESAPSIISALIAGATSTDTIAVTKIEAIPKNRRITTLRLYRTAAGSKDQAEYYWTGTDYTLPTIQGTWKTSASLGYNGEYWEFEGILYKCVNDGTTADPDDAVNGVGGSGAHHWEYYTVSDTVTTAAMLAIGLVCPSSTYLPPPDGLFCLRRLPNGCLVGAAGNAIYLSEPMLPHAWPDNSLTVNSDVVALGVYMSMIVVATQFQPEIITGDTIDTMYPTKLPAVFPCVSKRSICSGPSGVYYASNEGYVLVNDSGAVNVTAGIIDINDWKAILPANLHAQFYNNKIFAFNTASGTSFILDFESNSYASLDNTIHAAHVSTINSKFYVVMDTNSAFSVREWEGDGSNLMQYAWWSKEFRHSLTNWGAARIRIDHDFYAAYLKYLEENNTLADLNAAMIANLSMGGALCSDPLCALPMCGTNLYSLSSLAMSTVVTFQLWVDGVKRFEKAVQIGGQPFKLPGRYRGRRTQIRLYGYLPIAPPIEIANSMEELLNAAA